jgi:hypothetical protein
MYTLFYSIPVRFDVHIYDATKHRSSRVANFTAPQAPISLLLPLVIMYQFNSAHGPTRKRLLQTLLKFNQFANPFSLGALRPRHVNR